MQRARARLQRLDTGNATMHKCTSAPTHQCSDEWCTGRHVAAHGVAATRVWRTALEQARSRGYSGVLAGTHLSRVVVLRVLKLGSRVAIEYTPAWYAETAYLSAAACSACVRVRCVCCVG